MIKLNRGGRPEALTDEVCQELTKLYAQNKDKDVWNSPKIKKPLKEALLEMSHYRCSYCECSVEIESKDVTIDHFLPKSLHPDLVVEWKNLFPSCFRCNRAKNTCDEVLLNPCEDDPKEFLALHKKNPFRLKGIDAEGIGQKTIEEINLNDITRVMTPRMRECEANHQWLEKILQELNEYGYKNKSRKQLANLMTDCTCSGTYSAVKAANLLTDECYLRIRKIIMDNGQWNHGMTQLEEEIEQIALQIV